MALGGVKVIRSLESPCWYILPFKDTLYNVLKCQGHLMEFFEYTLPKLLVFGVFLGNPGPKYGLVALRMCSGNFILF